MIILHMQYAHIVWLMEQLVHIKVMDPVAVL